MKKLVLFLILLSTCTSCTRYNEKTKSIGQAISASVTGFGGGSIINTPSNTVHLVASSPTSGDTAVLSSTNEITLSFSGPVVDSSNVGQLVQSVSGPCQPGFGIQVIVIPPPPENQICLGVPNVVINGNELNLPGIILGPGQNYKILINKSVFPALEFDYTLLFKTLLAPPPVNTAFLVNSNPADTQTNVNPVQYPFNFLFSDVITNANNSSKIIQASDGPCNPNFGIRIQLLGTANCIGTANVNTNGTSISISDTTLAANENYSITIDKNIFNTLDKTYTLTFKTGTSGGGGGGNPPPPTPVPTSNPTPTPEATPVATAIPAPVSTTVLSTTPFNGQTGVNFNLQHSIQILFSNSIAALVGNNPLIQSTSGTCETKKKISISYLEVAGTNKFVKCLGTNHVSIQASKLQIQTLNFEKNKTYRILLRAGLVSTFNQDYEFTFTTGSGNVSVTLPEINPVATPGPKFNPGGTVINPGVAH